MKIEIPDSWSSEYNGSTYIPTIFRDLTHQADALDRQAFRLETLLSAVNDAESEYNRGPVEGILKAERFWNIQKPSRPVVSYLTVPSGKLRAEAVELRKKAQEIARNALHLLPVGTVIEAETAEVRHAGCPHGKPSLYCLRVEHRRSDGWQSTKECWWRLCADAGTYNGDNSREPGVWLDGGNWTAEGPEIMHRRGEVLMQIGNLKKVAGSYPPVPVKLTKISQVKEGS